MSTVQIKLNRPQATIHRTLKPRTVHVTPWGRGIGKSTFIRLCWYLLVAEWDHRSRPGAEHPGVRIVLLMPTLEQAKKVHAQLMQDELEGKWAFLGAKINRTDWRISFPGGSWIQWVTAERAANIRGLRCDAVFVDECDDIDIEIVDAIVMPWLSEPHSLAMLLFSGTPTRGRYGLLYKRHRMALDGVANNFTCHATYLDAPEHVDIARVERERPFIEPSLFAREWLCDFDAAEGLVYPMFSEHFHVRKPAPGQKWDRILVGGDHGYEDPAVFLEIGVAGHGKDAIAHVLSEVYKTHTTIEQRLVDVKRIKESASKLAPKATPKWFLDTAEPATNEFYKRSAGILLAEVDKSIEDGVSRVADMLFVRQPKGLQPFAKLFVDPSCKHTIREFGLYRRKRDPKNKDRILEDIQDKDNHAMDALRYAIFGYFGKAPPASGMG